MLSRSPGGSHSSCFFIPHSSQICIGLHSSQSTTRTSEDKPKTRPATVAVPPGLRCLIRRTHQGVVFGRYHTTGRGEQRVWEGRSKIFCILTSVSVAASLQNLALVRLSYSTMEIQWKQIYSVETTTEPNVWVCGCWLTINGKVFKEKVCFRSGCKKFELTITVTWLLFWVKMNKKNVIE